MDTQYTNQSLFNLPINDNLRNSLKSTAAVVGIAAILSLSSSLLKVVAAFLNKNKTPIESHYEGFNQTTASFERGSNIAAAIITLIISILLFYFLNRFASQTKTGLNANNTQIVNSGFGGLSGYFVTLGIILIICLALFLLGMVALLSVGGPMR
jgi:hypothetical protein